MDVTHRTMNAISKRDEAIRRWYDSDTASLPGKREEKDFKITFVPGAMLLAAVAASNFDEVERLIHQGANPNHVNVDGLSSLHQACIDENLEMVDLLVSLGANVDIRDNEGWTPLHAASSSGCMDIVVALLKRNADVSYVNTDGELAVDLADEDDIRELLEAEIKKQNVDVDKARNVEHNRILSDVRRWIKEGKMDDVRDVQGATALHVAASKSYLDVIQLLLDDLKMDVNIRDYDGWTPLHAAVYWKQRDAINALMSRNADPNAKTNAGIPPIDLADTDMISFFKSAIKKAMMQSRGKTEVDNKAQSNDSLPHITMTPKASALKKHKSKTFSVIEPAALPPVSKPLATYKKSLETEDHEKAEVSSYETAMELKKPPTRPPPKEDAKLLPFPKFPSKSPAKPPVKPIASAPRPVPIAKSTVEKSKLPVASPAGPKFPPSKVDNKVTDTNTNSSQTRTSSGSNIKLPQSKQKPSTPFPPNKNIKLPPSSKTEIPIDVKNLHTNNVETSTKSLSDKEHLAKALIKINELEERVGKLIKDNEELKNNSKASNTRNEEMEKLILQNKRLENENATLIKAMSVYSRNRTRRV